MKIINKPTYPVVECECCGLKGQLTKKDKIFHTGDKNYILCPVCNKEIIIKFDKNCLKTLDK